MEYVLVIPSSLTCMNEVRDFLKLVFNESKLDYRFFDKVFLGLSEAVHNAVFHGNGFDREKKVKVVADITASELLIEVSDDGDGFSLDQLEDPTCSENVKKETGRGIFLIRQTADQVDFLDGGKRILIRYILK